MRVLAVWFGEDDNSPVVMFRRPNGTMKFFYSVTERNLKRLADVANRKKDAQIFFSTQGWTITIL